MVTGGVGSAAIAILRHRGFQVTASTGRPEQANHLKALGGERDHRTQRARRTRKIAGKRALGGRHDAANSTTLADVLSMTRYRGTVDWRAAWICRLRSRRLSCVVLRFSASAPSYVRWPIGEWRDNGWRATSIGESLRP
jgi:hypothetical protein